MIKSPSDAMGQFRSLHRFPSVMDVSHWHLHLEIVFCAGTSILYEIAGRNVKVEPGQLLIFWAALPHRVAESSEGGEVFVINVPLEATFPWHLSDDAIAEYLEGGATVMTPPASYGKQTFEGWHKDFGSGDPAILGVVQLEIQALIRRVALSSSKTDSPAVRRSRQSSTGFGTNLRAIISILFSENSDSVTVQSIAENLGMNPKYLMSYFKSHTGVTLGTYIRKSKVAKARALLVETDLSTAQIVDDAGFGSISQFYAVMKAETRMTPKEIRESVVQAGSAAQIGLA